MSLTVLSVGYPLAAVSPDSAGGAEQILSALDRALVAAGHRSLVIAPEGSTVAGTLLPILGATGVLDDVAVAAAQARTRIAIASALASERIDVIHLHGIDFVRYLPPPGVPVLATLHLPPDRYSPEALRPARANTWLHCVSDTQQRACPPGLSLLPPIANGIALDAFRFRHAKRRFALFLGRICPEKGVHIAIAAARQAGMPLIIAGEVYAYASHQNYFAADVAPHLGRACRFVGPVGLQRKRRLLGAAACVLAPSLVAETSSLVAREAAASGTAVIAFPNGALADTIEHGRTGFLVPDAEGMAAAIRVSGTIDPDTCRLVATTRFSDRPMIAAYLATYGRLARGAVEGSTA